VTDIMGTAVGSKPRGLVTKRVVNPMSPDYSD